MLLICGISFLYMGQYLNEIHNSIINSNDAQMGSSTDMRDMQTEIAFYYFLQSPIWGNGVSFLFDYVALIDENILGGESVWYSLLVERGLIGVIAYLSIYILLYHYSTEKYIMFSFLLIQLTMQSLTSTPGLDFDFFIILGLLITLSNKYINFDYYAK